MIPKTTTVPICIVSMIIMQFSPPAFTAEPPPPGCSASAHSLLSACGNDAQNALWVRTARCQNESSEAGREACYRERRQAYTDDIALCRAQKAARDAACKVLGDAPYDPPLDPANFVDPLQIGAAVAPNPYLILTPGYTRNYRSPDELVTIRVTHQRRQVLGIKCIVVRDTVRNADDNQVTEDTLDYFAQDLAGNVWYFGETTAEYEDGFPVNTHGSFIAGQRRAKPGFGIPAMPATGKLYREEFDLGNAEDLARVLKTTASESAPAATCRNTCVETENTTPLEPDSVEHKFYAPGIGEIVSFDAADPEIRTELVSYHY